MVCTYDNDDDDNNNTNNNTNTNTYTNTNTNKYIIYFRAVAHSAVLIYKGPSIYNKITKNSNTLKTLYASVTI